MIQYFQSFPYYAFDRDEVICLGFFPIVDRGIPYIVEYLYEV